MGPIARAALLLVSAALLLAGCGLDSPMTTVEPKSDLGRAIHDLFMNISGWALLIFVVVEALLPSKFFEAMLVSPLADPRFVRPDDCR